MDWKFLKLILIINNKEVDRYPNLLFISYFLNIVHPSLTNLLYCYIDLVDY